MAKRKPLSKNNRVVLTYFKPKKIRIVQCQLYYTKHQQMSTDTMTGDPKWTARRTHACIGLARPSGTLPLPP